MSVNEIGADRVLFSVDYPYETVENGCGWWDNGAKAIQVAAGGVNAFCCIGRKEAAQAFHDSDAPVV
jgi:2,3-dihydroxybenzoate decarboxylase